MPTSVENLKVEEESNRQAAVEDAKRTLDLAQLSVEDQRILRYMEESVRMLVQPTQLARALRLSSLKTRSRLEALRRLGLVERAPNPAHGEPEFMLTAQGGDAVVPLPVQRRTSMNGSPRIRLTPDFGDGH
jgi:RIO-like serine/threonine protein kinase